MAKSAGRPLEADLVTALVLGDQAAWLRVVDEFSPKMLKYAQRKGLNFQTAEDAVQEAFTGAFLKLCDRPTAVLEGAIIFWCWQLVRQGCIKQFRGRLAHQLIFDPKRFDLRRFRRLMPRRLFADPRRLLFGRLKETYATAVIAKDRRLLCRVAQLAAMSLLRISLPVRHLRCRSPVLYPAWFYWQLRAGIAGQRPGGGTPPVNLNPAPGDGGLLNKMLGTTCSLLDAVDNEDLWERAFAGLSEDERRVVHRRYFEGATRPQVVNELGISVDQVRQIEKRAIRKLMRFFIVSARLDKEERQVLCLVCVDGDPIQNVAAVLKKPLAEVEAIIARAIANLWDFLRGDEGEPPGQLISA